MTDKDIEKAREIGNSWANAKCLGKPMYSDIIAERAALEMADWKEQQMIEKAWNWFMNKYGFNDYNAFKKYMEE